MKSWYYKLEEKNHGGGEMYMSALAHIKPEFLGIYDDWICVGEISYQEYQAGRGLQENAQK